VKPSHAANVNLIDRTHKVWQPRIGRTLTNEDVRQIAENVINFFSILAEWSRTPAIDTVNPVASDKEEVRHER
jgi:hypothetical protein